jgi:drug/metabolite transporter (DMT)-like permease
MSKKFRGNMMLFTTALIWGTSFVAQKAGMDYIGPFTFNGLRSLLGALVLIPVILIMDAQRKKNSTQDKLEKDSTEDKLEKDSSRKTLLIGGLSCGLMLFIGSSLQQHSLLFTTVGKVGFITALYIVIVPILGLFIGRKVRPVLWFCVALATVGLYLLCIKEDFSIGKGDLLVIACAFGFALHILVIDHFSPKTDGIKLSCIQFFVCGVFSIPFMFLFETADWSNILDCWLQIFYVGVMSCGVAYTLQILGQKYTEPTIASLILSLESVFAVIFGILLLNEQVSGREIIGCVIMFSAFLLAQLPSKKEAQVTSLERTD